MADKPAPEDSTAEAITRENLRLARRVGRLELLLAQVEQIRDGNEQLLGRLMDDLQVERQRSHQLLLNILPEKSSRASTLAKPTSPIATTSWPSS